MGDKNPKSKTRNPQQKGSPRAQQAVKAKAKKSSRGSGGDSKGQK